MKECLLVGLGGALGAMLRYLLSLLPVGGHLPLMTLSINVMAALLMGFFTGCLDWHSWLDPQLGLLLRAGLRRLLHPFLAGVGAGGFGSGALLAAGGGLCRADAGALHRRYFVGAVAGALSAALCGLKIIYNNI